MTSSTPGTCVSARFTAFSHPPHVIPVTVSCSVSDMSGCRPFTILLITLSIVACARPMLRTPAAVRDLQVVGYYILPEQPFGDSHEIVAELSGAWYDEASRQLFVVSDRGD